MNDSKICEEFGITIDEVDEIVSEVEAGDLSDYDSSNVIEGQPLGHKSMEMISCF